MARLLLLSVAATTAFVLPPATRPALALHAKKGKKANKFKKTSGQPKQEKKKVQEERFDAAKVSPLLQQYLHVARVMEGHEAAGPTLIGRAGHAVRAFEVTEASGAKWTRLAALEDTAADKAKRFFVNSAHVQETQPSQSPEESQPKPSWLDCFSRPGPETQPKPTRPSHAQQARSRSKQLTNRLISQGHLSPSRASQQEPQQEQRPAAHVREQGGWLLAVQTERREAGGGALAA